MEVYRWIEKNIKQAFDRERYERIELKVPKGMKSIIKSLANDKGMSVNAHTCKTSSEKTSVECLTRCRLQKRTEK